MGKATTDHADDTDCTDPAAKIFRRDHHTGEVLQDLYHLPDFLRALVSPWSVYAVCRLAASCILALRSRSAATANTMIPPMMISWM